MAAADLTHPPDVKAVVTKTADDVLHFVEVLCEWLVPLIGIILGLFIGPRIFSGQAVTDALWNLGIQSAGPSGGYNASLIGSLAAAGVVGVAAGSLWNYQEGRKGWVGLISRALSGFTIGWALGALLVGLNVYFVTGSTARTPGWLDNAINTFAINAISGTPPLVPAPPT
ncbi:MAG: hypothetical protein L3K19_09490 [Thermoplasmata archaeon]|nr:hypothetical protein [Thermoplasmata archaeon]